MPSRRMTATLAFPSPPASELGAQVSGHRPGVQIRAAKEVVIERRPVGEPCVEHEALIRRRETRAHWNGEDVVALPDDGGVERIVHRVVVLPANAADREWLEQPLL